MGDEKKGKIRKAVSWLVSIGDPVPYGIGTTYESLKRMRDSNLAYEQANAEIEKQNLKLKSFEDYVTEYGLTNKQLESMRKRFYIVSLVFFAAFLGLLMYSIALIDISVFYSIGAFFISLIFLAQFMAFNLRHYQIRHRYLCEFSVWLSNPLDWFI